MKQIEFDLYIDESGAFESGIGRPDQLAGILAPRGGATPALARGILRKAAADAGIADAGSIHSCNLPRGAQFDRLVLGVLAGVRQAGWQPARMVNKERIAYGDKAENYTNLFAEFVLRVCATLRNQRHDDLSIRPIAALVELPEQDARSYIEQQQYATRMNDVLKRSALREGWSDDARHWSVESPDLRPGSRPQLQVCDVLSNASWNGCSKCGPEARAQLLASLRQFDFTLQVWPLVDQVEHLIGKREHGLALKLVCEKLIEGSLSKELREALDLKLAGLTSPSPSRPDPRGGVIW